VHRAGVAAGLAASDHVVDAGQVDVDGGQQRLHAQKPDRGWHPAQVVGALPEGEVAAKLRRILAAREKIAPAGAGEGG